MSEVLKETYEVQHVLGEGALGRTMLAFDRSRSNAPVAVKELLPSRMKRWKDLDLFHRECSTLQALSHPGIPRYYDDFVIEGDEGAPPRLFLVQQFVDGKSLQDLLDEGEPFDEPRVRDLLRQLLEILDYLHSRNPPVIHRDIKPANLMLSPDGRLMLIDFGAVREAVTFDGVGSTIVGTFGYMPPEQYAGQSVPATDLFAVGATCVQLLTGKPPSELFEGLHQFKIPSDLPVTLGFENLLLRLTEPDVEKRFQTTREVLQELDLEFLMVPKDEIVGALPIPHEIRPAPRPFPGFFLRDAYHGRSHLIVVIMCVFGVLLTAVFPVVVIATNQPAFAVLGGFAVLIAMLLSATVTKKARTEIDVYRRGSYALGEVTGVFWSSNSNATNLTYRYRVGDQFQHGSVSTVDKTYSELSPGDPIGVIYLPELPSEHVMYAVPRAWAQTQNVGVNQRLLDTSKT
ncbi:MAG: serine/threonine-protein kinase [bacterium]